LGDSKKDATTLRIICGPTAAGKSRVAFAIASRNATTLLVADSRQIYRGFDIGTAKPTREEQALVPHRGIDVVEPVERYSAYRWATDALAWIAEAEGMSLIPLVVGGTGFYIRALVDPPRDWPPLGRRFLPRYLVVDPGPALANHIESRVDEMLAHGWAEEVRGLEQTVPNDAPAWLASGYRMLRRVVRGETTIEAARERIVIETRQYAKRQRTWFRHQLDPERVTRLDPAATDWERVVMNWWNA
jgi:tRNA A37 N6-isopentenylltransferase MiaA